MAVKSEDELKFVIYVFSGHWTVSYSTLLEPGLSSLPIWIQFLREYAGGIHNSLDYISVGIWDTHFHIEYAGGIHNSEDCIGGNLGYTVHFYIEYAGGIHNSVDYIGGNLDTHFFIYRICRWDAQLCGLYRRESGIHISI